MTERQMSSAEHLLRQSRAMVQRTRAEATEVRQIIMRSRLRLAASAALMRKAERLDTAMRRANLGKED